MPIALRDITRKRKEKDQENKKQKPLIPAVLCTVGGAIADAGGKALSARAEGDVNYVWAMTYGDGTPAKYRHRVATVSDLTGTPVYLGYFEDSIEIEVYSVNTDVMVLDEAELPKSQHADTHLPWGYDPLTVYKRAHAEFKLTVADGLNVAVTAYEYDDLSGNRAVYPGTNSKDLTASVPGTAGQARWVLVYLDKADNTLKTVDGTVGPDVPTYTLTKPNTPSGGVACAYVRLAYGQTEISEADIDDGRRQWGSGGGSGGAPTDAQYVTLATNATLTNERVLTAGDGIDLTDGGAGSTITASLDINGLTGEAAADDADTIAIYDDSAGALKKQTRANLLGSLLRPTIADAKGDLLVATAADTIARLAVSGNNGYVLTEDSGEASGLKWAAAGSGAWPFDDVITVGGADADYQTLQDAIDDCSGGEQILVGVDLTEDATVDVAVEIYGVTRDITITGNLTLTAAAKVRNLTLVQTGTGTDNAGVTFQTNAALVEDCTIQATGAGTNNYAVSQFGNYFGNELRNCDVLASGATNNYAVHLGGIAGTPNGFTITGGKLSGATDDVYLNKSDMTLYLRQGPILANNDLNAPFGAWTGHYTMGGGDWYTFTPTVTQSGSVTVTVVLARYKIVEKICHMEIILSVTGTGSAGNNIVIGGIPAAAAIKNQLGGLLPVGFATVLDNGTTLYTAQVNDNASGTSVVLRDTNTAGIIGTNPSFALANGDALVLNMTYEVA